MKDRRSSALTFFLTGPDFDVFLQRFARPRGRTRHQLAGYDGTAEGLLFFVFTARSASSRATRTFFQQMLHSVRLKQ